MRGPYLRPNWAQRNIANRLVPRFRPDVVTRLSVRGRRSGRWRTVPVSVMEEEGERYLVSYRGASDWSLNLAAAGRGRLHTQQGVVEIDVEEVPVEKRPPLLRVYLDRYGKMPTVGSVMKALPDPADHPTFRIVASRLIATESRKPGDPRLDSA